MYNEISYRREMLKMICFVWVIDLECEISLMYMCLMVLNEYRALQVFAI